MAFKLVSQTSSNSSNDVNEHFSGAVTQRDVRGGRATLALNSGEWFFRFFILDRHFLHSIHLNNWPKIPRPPLSIVAGNASNKGFVKRNPIA